MNGIETLPLNGIAGDEVAGFETNREVGLLRNQLFVLAARSNKE